MSQVVPPLHIVTEKEAQAGHENVILKKQFQSFLVSFEALWPGPNL